VKNVESGKISKFSYQLPEKPCRALLGGADEGVRPYVVPGAFDSQSGCLLGDARKKGAGVGRTLLLLSNFIVASWMGYTDRFGGIIFRGCAMS
jgi:hypothetical protein